MKYRGKEIFWVIGKGLGLEGARKDWEICSEIESF
jgi:hypothetical protein